MKRQRGRWLKRCRLYGSTYVPSVHNMVQSIRIDFVCSSKLFLGFTAVAGRAFTHTEVTLVSASRLPLAPSFCCLTRPPTRFAATRCCSATLHHNRTSVITASTRVCQTNDPPSPCFVDKYSPTPLSCLSDVWFISLSPRIATSPPDAFSFRQITGST